MSVFRALVRRELSVFFQGPTGFITIAAVLFLIGLGFVIVLSGLNRSRRCFTAPIFSG